MDRKKEKIICVETAPGKRHDYKVFKESKVHIHPDSNVLADSGYQGIHGRHAKTELPKKKSKKKPLTPEEKANNRHISSRRVFCENVISRIKRFKIIADRYRNRRKRFGLRINLIAAIINIDFAKK